MSKRVAITVETARPKPLSTLITGPKRKLEQDKYEATTSTLGATSIPTLSPIEIDPLAPPATDQLAAGTAIYEELILTSGKYCPTYLPSFYRRVWFDGLEAFPIVHYTIDPSNGCITPGSVLPTPVTVTASYVKSY